MKNKKLTTYQMAVTAVMAAVMCVLSPLSIPIGAVPIAMANLVICFAAWLLGPKFGTLSVAIYLLIGLIGVPVFAGYSAGVSILAGPTGGYLVGDLPGRSCIIGKNQASFSFSTPACSRRLRSREPMTQEMTILARSNAIKGYTHTESA